jgi:signal transduction histidine kinase/CheY-like chemotaxis protein
MTSTVSNRHPIAPRTTFRRGLNYVAGLIGIGLTYFVLAKSGLALALIHPSASSIWPPTGFALAAIVLWGYRVWPAIFLAAMIANATAAGSIGTAISIATGNSLEALAGAALINVWSNGRDTFSTSNTVAKFTVICVVLATPISATVGITSLAIAGYVEWANFANVWLTWWLGDLISALVVTPVVVLLARSDALTFSRTEVIRSAVVISLAVAIGFIAFNPSFKQSQQLDPLSFLAVLPLLWAALHRGPRDTAIASFILAGFSIWGTLSAAGPLTSTGLNDALLLVLVFLISVSIPSLALSADAAMRKKIEENLRRTHAELDHRVEMRTVELAGANQALQDEVARRARIESELKGQRLQLEFANTAKSRFLAMASHDLRQPLHALGLFVAQLRTPLKSRERAKTIERVDAAVREMNEMFNSLLDISRLDAGILKPKIVEFPIARLLQKLETTFDQTTREKGLRLLVMRSDAWVRSDPLLLERILLNLVSNAVRYTLRGGIVVGCRRRSKMLRIEVWDSGPGIPEDQKQNIFGEFFQLPAPERDRYGGLGLGLAIVDRLRRLLNHQIELTSTVGRGTRFTILVPMAAAECVTSVQTVGSPHPAAFEVEGKVIVVIDDFPIVLEGTSGLLGKWGCSVVTAGSDEAALIQLAEREQRPDLIISDYHLASGKTGIEAIERINAAFGASIRAILISGDTAPDRLRDARDKGYILLHKPVDPMRLRAVMHQLFKDQDDRRDTVNALKGAVL